MKLNTEKSELYGLVICGGQSTRMGTDKSLIVYYQKPQRYHVYDLLGPFCEKVFLSCNQGQASTIPDSYATLTDLPVYENIGPMAALLTAFSAHPEHDFLVLACDYPLITEKDLKVFLQNIETDQIASAFYKKEHSVYEPLIAWYSQRSFTGMRRMFDNKQYSLQQFLKENKAGKYEPFRPENVMSVDTQEDCKKTKEIINRRNHF